MALLWKTDLKFIPDKHKKKIAKIKTKKFVKSIEQRKIK
jgi:hypothetical protein